MLGKLNELNADETLENVREFVRDFDFLQEIKVTGKGRTKAVIISEINQKIRIRNLTHDVKMLSSKVNEMQETRNKEMGHFLIELKNYRWIVKPAVMFNVICIGYFWMILASETVFGIEIVDNPFPLLILLLIISLVTYFQRLSRSN